MTYTVKQLADLAHVSPRTLHYYDEIGLLTPSTIADNGYRQYGEAELVRLQQILFFRELEFPLTEIKQILNRPDFRVVDILKDQKKMLQLKQKRLDNLLQTIDNTIKHMVKNNAMKAEEMYDAFKDDDMKHYQAEAKQRWGHTDAYKQSMARVSKMTKQQMEKLKADGNVFTKQLADSMDKGIHHPDVQALIEKHYQGIQFFYDCSIEMYRNLGKMYVDDPRFTAYYDKFRPGLAVFVRDAIEVYCDRKEK